MDDSELRIDQRVRKPMRTPVCEALVTGLAVVVPLLGTAIVLAIALQYVHDYRSQFAAVGGVDGSCRQMSDVVLDSDTVESADYLPTGREER